MNVQNRTQLPAVLNKIWNWVKLDVEHRDKDPRREGGREWIRIRRRNNDHRKSNHRVRNTNTGVSRRNMHEDVEVLRETPFIDSDLHTIEQSNINYNSFLCIHCPFTVSHFLSSSLFTPVA